MRLPLPAWMAIAALLFALVSTPARAAHKPMPSGSQPEVRVGILLFDQVQIIDFTGPYEVFGTAGFGVATVSRDGKPVTTAMGLAVTPDHGFADAPEFDVLLIPGGEVDKPQGDPVVLDFIRNRATKAKHVLSVCTGAYILAATGLLDGQKATTFFPQLDGLARSHPKVEVVSDQRWVDNGKVITSAGLSSGIDAALHVVARLRGEMSARSVALHLEYDWHPEQGFVRGRMADRYMPKLNKVEWPKDFAAERLYSVGDEHAWRIRVRIRTATAQDEIVRRIVSDIEASDWKRDQTATGYHWMRRTDGGQIGLTLTQHPVAAGEFELEIATSVLNRTTSRR